MSEREKKGFITLKVNLPMETAGALKLMATRQGLNLTETVKKTIATSEFIIGQLNQGCTFLVEDADGKVTEVDFEKYFARSLPADDKPNL